MQSENMGWQCPKCLVVYAPSVEKCECSILPKVSYSGFGTTSLSGYSCNGFTSNSSNGICSKCGLPQWKHYNLTNI